MKSYKVNEAGENVVPTIYIQRELELLEADKITVHEAARASWPDITNCTRMERRR